MFCLSIIQEDKIVLNFRELPMYALSISCFSFYISRLVMENNHFEVLGVPATLRPAMIRDKMAEERPDVSVGVGRAIFLRKVCPWVI